MYKIPSPTHLLWSRSKLDFTVTVLAHYISLHVEKSSQTNDDLIYPIPQKLQMDFP